MVGRTVEGIGGGSGLILSGAGIKSLLALFFLLDQYLSRFLQRSSALQWRRRRMLARAMGPAIAGCFSPFERHGGCILCHLCNTRGEKPFYQPKKAAFSLEGAGVAAGFCIS